MKSPGLHSAPDPETDPKFFSADYRSFVFGFSTYGLAGARVSETVDMCVCARVLWSMRFLRGTALWPSDIAAPLARYIAEILVRMPFPYVYTRPKCSGFFAALVNRVYTYRSSLVIQIRASGIPAEYKYMFVFTYEFETRA